MRGFSLAIRNEVMFWLHAEVKTVAWEDNLTHVYDLV